MKRKDLFNLLKIFCYEFADFFFPSFCASCKTKLFNPQKHICPTCINSFQIAAPERIQFEFDRKFTNDKLISGFQPAFVFEKDKELQNILHALKYDKKFLLGNFLGKISAEQVKDILNSWKADLIVPVPLHSLKKAERGFNQADFICKGMSKVISVPVKPNLIKRKKYTLSQTTMTLKERKENVHEAFTINKKISVEGKRIIIVDDVITTGATISECARILLENGAEKIFAFSVAVAD